MTKKHHKLREFTKFLTHPKTRAKISAGFKSVVEGTERINYGMEETIGLPHKRQVNPLPHMAEGVMHTLPKNVHKHKEGRLGRVVVRRPYRFP
jgi:hypothetical protein